MNLELFKNNSDLHAATKELFKEQLQVKINELPSSMLSVKDYFKDLQHPLFENIQAIFTVGLVNERTFQDDTGITNWQAEIDYQTIFIIAVDLKKALTRSELVALTRLLNRPANTNDKGNPVIAIFRYENKITLSSLERQARDPKDWRDGEKISTTKVSMLKDVDFEKPHAAHLKILSGLKIDVNKSNTFEKIYRFWQKQLSIQALNDKFYADLQNWFYYAAQKIKLPYKPDYIDEKENTKNFLIRLLARTMFCWFVKEKGLIQKELLELKNWDETIYPLTNDFDSKDFLHSNSYYRGILQNVFYNALNQKDKKSLKDFKWTRYWHKDLPINWFTDVPYLNGGIFDQLEEDNAKESIEDSVIEIPNYLFYGIEIEQSISKGKGTKVTTQIQKIEHKGLNGILKSYKFTLDENTPYEEDIALDPEMLGLVFENLLAELDPNLEESTIKSIRKLTGSFYTPRKTILEMVNDSLYLYLNNYLKKYYSGLKDRKKKVNNLIHQNTIDSNDTLFCQAIVEALDKFKMLDPACGSGAFPMGMLHRMVDILKLIDPKNVVWIDLKLKNVDKAQQTEFKKVLNSHLDDYSRKLGIIRDSIYGIDIQPLAVQITKLRFFISLLIDQEIEKGITPMPNIETKIICADSLKNIQADLFSKDAIEKLIEARTRYYQPDLSQIDRQSIADEIIDVLDEAFPSFAFQVTGKKIVGQNKELIRHWFTHGTLAAPFFNMDFFFPELMDTGGFDCVIGNPPYGGMKISDEIRTALDIESKDPYGAFIARFLNAHNQTTPLKQGGVLAYIVSDTFMTIKSHLKLRKHLMQNYVHKMLRVHPDTFRATVNTVIMVAERNTQRELDENHICLMADLTNISIHDNYEHFGEVLNQTKGVDFETLKANISNEEYAIYYYPQALIKTNSNLPFFVASPKLFALMNDSGKKLKKELKQIGGKQVQVRKIPINDKEIEVVKLGDVEKIAKGMDSHINYVYRASEEIPVIRTHYSVVENKKIKKQSDIDNLTDHEKLNGVDNCSDFIVPFNKGGSSDSSDGWLPNYFVPIEYYIDWSVEAVRNHYHRNKILYFKKGLTFSFRGEYSPTFRIKNVGPFDANSSFISSECFDNIFLLTVLSSRFIRFFFNGFVQHTVASDVDKIKEIPILNLNLSSFLKLTNAIIKKQKANPRYDYASHEQIEIDKLVYETYGLNAEDVQEVENWYARRYPKLSAAQKANLRALGKSDDYLELYGLK